MKYKKILMIFLCIFSVLLCGCNNKNNNEVKEFEFENDELIAVGIYPTSETTHSKLANKYLNDTCDFYDGDESSYYMIVIPKTSEMTINLYDAEFTDEGKVIKGEKILTTNAPFIKTIGEFEYIPHIIIEVENDKTYDVDFTFSGLDGSIVYGQDSEIVHDISFFQAEEINEY